MKYGSEDVPGAKDHGQRRGRENGFGGLEARAGWGARVGRTSVNRAVTSGAVVPAAPSSHKEGVGVRTAMSPPEPELA